ncbi:MAG: AAA family ATPase [Bacteroidales bacterium]|nr:AAA family ATPase [Bacteroidales bacterium]
MSINLKEYFNTLKELILLEKKADQDDFLQKINSTSFIQLRKEGVCWYPAIVESTSFDMAERFTIKISRPKEHTENHLFQSGKAVCLFVNINGKIDEKCSVNGTINKLSDNVMNITLNCDDEPEWINMGKVGVQLLFDETSYSESVKCLNKLATTDNKRIIELCSILLTNKNATKKEHAPITIPNLNESQNIAVNEAIAANDIAIIHGPPGTGKTTTLIEAVKQCLKTEKQVMVSAPSNAAVDLLVNKLDAAGIKVVRIGNPARVTEEQLNKTLDAQIANHADYKMVRAMKKQIDEFRHLAGKYKRNFGQQEREQRRLLYAEATKLHKESQALEDFIVNDILNKSQVIACTLVGATNYKLKAEYIQPFLLMKLHKVWNHIVGYQFH